MDILKIIESKDMERITEALREIHRRKAHALVNSDLEESARLHAYHIALMSAIMPEAEVAEDSITGMDYRLAKSFRESVLKCEKLPTYGDGFYNSVVRELNSLVDFLCKSSLDIANNK